MVRAIVPSTACGALTCARAMRLQGGQSGWSDVSAREGPGAAHRATLAIDSALAESRRLARQSAIKGTSIVLFHNVNCKAIVNKENPLRVACVGDRCATRAFPLS